MNERIKVHRRGMTNIINAHEGQLKRSGLYGDDLQILSRIYGSIADMCYDTHVEKRKAMYVILGDSALSLFTRKGRDRKSFEEGVSFLGS